MEAESAREEAIGAWMADVMLATDAPRDLHALEYSRWICENVLGIPPAKSNLEVISQAIEAVSKAKFRDKPRPIFTAFLWLERQARFAVMEGRKVNHLFFLNGDYNDVAAQEKMTAPEYKPVSQEEYEAAKKDRASYFASDEYKAWLVKMGQKGLK